MVSSFKLAFSLFLAISVTVVPARSAQRNLDHGFVDSLVKVFPEDAPGKYAQRNPQMVAARNGHASVQFVMRAQHKMADIDVSVEGFDASQVKARARAVGYVVVAVNTKDTAESELVHRAPGLFPDVLLEKFPISLEPRRTQSIWLTFEVMREASPGIYSGAVVVKQAGKEILRAPLQLRVVAAAVPAERSLKVTNWFYLTDRQLRMFFHTRILTDEWWDLLANMARVMAQHRQNMIVTPLTGFYFSRLALIQARPVGGGLEYDFSNFDRWVETTGLRNP